MYFGIFRNTNDKKYLEKDQLSFRRSSFLLLLRGWEEEGVGPVFFPLKFNRLLHF